MTLAERRAAALARRSPATPTLVEVPEVETDDLAHRMTEEMQGHYDRALAIHPADVPVEVAIAARPLADPRPVRDLPSAEVGGVARGMGGEVPVGVGPAGRGLAGGAAAEVAPDGPPGRGLASARSGDPVPALVMGGHARCWSCGGAPRTVRTPWGGVSMVNGPARGAHDSAAGSERIVVVHAGGISRLVVPGPEWTGVVVEGWELHHCGGHP